MTVRMNNNCTMNADRTVSVCAISSALTNGFFGTALSVPFFAFSRFYNYFYYYFYFSSETAKCRKCFG